MMKKTDYICRDMEKDELLTDEFLRKFVKKAELEEPSEDFVEKIMGQIGQQPEPVKVKRPFYLYLKSSSGYIALAAFVIFVILTSDMPFIDFLPGKQYFRDIFLPYFNTLFLSLKSLFIGKSLTIPLMILVSAGLFYLVDQLISKKATA
jgi:hypothetical protein